MNETIHAQGAKKGGQKKGQNGSGGGSGIPQAGAVKRPYTDTDVIMQNLLLVENFSRKLGRLMLPLPGDFIALHVCLAVAAMCRTGQLQM